MITFLFRAQSLHTCAQVREIADRVPNPEASRASDGSRESSPAGSSTSSGLGPSQARDDHLFAPTPPDHQSLARCV